MGGDKVFQYYKNAPNVASFCYGNDRGPRNAAERQLFDDTIDQAERLLAKQKALQEWEDEIEALYGEPKPLEAPQPTSLPVLRDGGASKDHDDCKLGQLRAAVKVTDQSLLDDNNADERRKSQSPTFKTALNPPLDDMQRPFSADDFQDRFPPAENNDAPVVNF